MVSGSLSFWTVEYTKKKNSKIDTPREDKVRKQVTVLTVLTYDGLVTAVSRAVVSVLCFLDFSRD